MTAPTPDEAAAIAAAIAQFERDTAPPQPSEPRISPWVRAALREGVDREPLT